MNPNSTSTLLFEAVENNTFNDQECLSDNSCCDYHSDDSVPEWDDSIKDNGELFFIKCSPIIRNDNLNTDLDIKSEATYSKHNKFPKFLKKRKVKKKSVVGIKKEANDLKAITLKVNDCGARVFESIPEYSAAVLYLNVENLENNDCSFIENIQYFFPQATDKNLIYLISGALLTLHHLLPKLVFEKPESSSILIKDELVHLVYVTEGKELMILAFPENKCSLFELTQLSVIVKRCLNLKHKSLHECFSNSNNHISLHQFFGNLFIKLLKRNINLSAIEKLEFETITDEIPVQFEDTFIFPIVLTVPHHLEMKIHEKLNEIEANDFGDLSEDHYGCQRLYVIIGTCLYHKGYLITSHFHRDDQLDVHCFLRFNDLLDLTVTSTIESLVIWQEIYLSSYNYNLENSVSFTPNRRWFLLVIGQDQSLLVTILESGGCSIRKVGLSKPDELYVEQLQDSLSDILNYGLADAVDQVIKQSKPTVFDSPQKQLFQKSKNLLNTFNNTMAGYSGKKVNESDSTTNSEINGTYHHFSSTLIEGNFNDTFSESLSRTTSSVFSDETVPVLGRRAQRLKQLSNSDSIYSLSHCNLSDSDRSDYDTTGSSHSSSFAELNRKNLKDINTKRIIHGDEKILFHYVNLNSAKGIIIDSFNDSHFECNKKYQYIINNFRLSAQKIHSVLTQKKTSNIERFQKHTVPVKEYGILFEYFNEDEDEKKDLPIIYWTVGRMFNKPNLGEIYACYEDKTPQNLVEIAFRLSMSS